MKYDSSSAVTHDRMNTGDKVWFLSEKQKYIAVVLEVGLGRATASPYTIAYFDNGEWKIVGVAYEKIFPRVQDDKQPNIFEIYDTVLINTEHSKTLGVVIGYEIGMNVIMKYAGKIWRRVVLPSNVLEHHSGNYDEILFNNRKQLLAEQTWLRWNLP